MELQAIIQILFYSIAGISLLSLLIIFVLFMFTKSLREYPNWQIIFLSISTYISTCSYFIYKKENEGEGEGDMSPYCLLQGFTMVWFDMSIYFWATLINYSVYYHTIHFDLIESESIPIHWWIGDFTFGYLFPFAYATLLAGLGVIGLNGDYCWIKENYHVPLITYMIAWVLMLFNILLSCRVIYYIYNLPQEDKDYVKDYVSSLLAFPIIQMVVTIPGSVNRLLTTMADEANTIDKTLANISKSCFALMGLLIALAFGRKMKLFNVICRCCCKKNKVTPEIEEGSYSDRKYNINFRSSILEDDVPF